MSRFLDEVAAELELAQRRYSPFASAHEGESVLREEFEELVAWVRVKPERRAPAKMRRECIQIAAMAARFADEVCDTGLANER
mgnify:FL=1